MYSTAYSLNIKRRKCLFLKKFKKKDLNKRNLGLSLLEFPGFAGLLLQRSLRADCDHGHMNAASGSEK